MGYDAASLVQIITGAPCRYISQMIDRKGLEATTGGPLKAGAGTPEARVAAAASGGERAKIAAIQEDAGAETKVQEGPGKEEVCSPVVHVGRMAGGGAVEVHNRENTQERNL